MPIDRRHFALSAAALALAGAAPAFAGADEDEITKKLEAFRAAQQAGNADGITPLLPAKLSFNHSIKSINDKAKLLN